MRKRNCYFLFSFLVLLIICSLMLSVEANNSHYPSNISLWQFPEEFVDPVTTKINEFKSFGLNDEEITTELDELGMGWFPLTGATWIGKSLTSEEVTNLPIRKAPAVEYPIENSPFENSFIQYVGLGSNMRTSSSSWTGVASEVISGSMAVASGETIFHYLCMQLGNLDSGTNWVETVLTHNLGETYKWHTYDSDEGGWTYYKNKDTPITALDTYVILLDGQQDEFGWNYDVWINYNWVRSGHLSNLWVQAGFQKEVYSTTGTFTDDSSSAIFYRNWVHNAQGWPYWTNSVNTWWSSTDPVQENHFMGASSYYWETWLEN